MRSQHTDTRIQAFNLLLQIGRGKGFLAMVNCIYSSSFNLFGSSFDNYIRNIIVSQRNHKSIIIVQGNFSHHYLCFPETNNYNGPVER